MWRPHRLHLRLSRVDGPGRTLNRGETEAALWKKGSNSRCFGPVRTTGEPFSSCFGPVITTGEPSSKVGQREETCRKTGITTTFPTPEESAAAERAATPTQFQSMTLGVTALDLLCNQAYCCLPTPGIPTTVPTYSSVCCFTTAYQDRNQNC